LWRQGRCLYPQAASRFHQCLGGRISSPTKSVFQSSAFGLDSGPSEPPRLDLPFWPCLNSERDWCAQPYNIRLENTGVMTTVAAQFVLHRTPPTLQIVQSLKVAYGLWTVPRIWQARSQRRARRWTITIHFTVYSNAGTGLLLVNALTVQVKSARIPLSVTQT